MEPSSTEDAPNQEKNHETGAFVDITIDGLRHNIHRGSTTVSELKSIGQIPGGYDLVIVIDGRTTVLPDDGRVTIKGGEIFVRQVKSCGSSW